jgi:hypothetical protein
LWSLTFSLKRNWLVRLFTTDRWLPKHCQKHKQNKTPQTRTKQCCLFPHSLVFVPLLLSQAHTIYSCFSEPICDQLPII